AGRRVAAPDRRGGPASVRNPATYGVPPARGEATTTAQGVDSARNDAVSAAITGPCAASAAPTPRVTARTPWRSHSVACTAAPHRSQASATALGPARPGSSATVPTMRIRPHLRRAPPVSNEAIPGPERTQPEDPV